MRVYTYYMIPGRTALSDAVAVREGFSWGATLFGFVWALYHRLWLEAVLFAAVQAVLVYMGLMLTGVPLEAGAAFIALFMVFTGCNANDFRRDKLERKGHVLAGIAVARSLAEADRRFFERAAVQEPAPSSLPRP